MKTTSQQYTNKEECKSLIVKDLEVENSLVLIRNTITRISHVGLCFLGIQKQNYIHKRGEVLEPRLIYDMSFPKKNKVQVELILKHIWNSR